MIFDVFWCHWWRFFYCSANQDCVVSVSCFTMFGILGEAWPDCPPPLDPPLSESTSSSSVGQWLGDHTQSHNFSNIYLVCVYLNWRQQQTTTPDGAADSASGDLRALHARSLNNASTMCHQMIEKQHWPPNNSPNLNTMEISCLGLWGTTHKTILKSSSEAHSGSKVAPDNKLRYGTIFHTFN